jgi:hypothetical protein
MEGKKVASVEERKEGSLYTAWSTHERRGKNDKKNQKIAAPKDEERDESV